MLLSFLITLVFGGLTTVLKSSYYAERRFIYPELSQLIPGILVLLGIIWALPVYGIVSVAWGAVIRWMIQAIIKVVAFNRAGVIGIAIGIAAYQFS